MSTRDQTRRELKDLAKLAAVIPRERPSIPAAAPEHSGTGPSPSRVTVPPAIASVSTPPPFLPSAPPAFPVASVAPAPSVLSVAPAPPTRSGGSGIWAVLAGAGLAAAMVSGLVLGRALASHPAAASAVAPGSPITGHENLANEATESAATAAPPAASAVVGATVPPVTDTADDTHSVPPTTDNPPPTVTLRAPRPAHHAEARPATKPAGASAVSAPNTKAPAPAKVPATHPGATHDSLDDLIRKAAGSN
jgi:hypothetical protein